MDREIRNNLRDEYFRLLPDIRKILEEIEATISYALVSIKKNLKSHERIALHSRVKDCESAINKLRPQGGKFLPNQAEEYSLLKLKDLAGVRVLVFPRRLMEEVDKQISVSLSGWTPKPIKRDDASEEILVKKYFGYIDNTKDIYGEYQITPMLIGLFWQVEHAVLYKPSSVLKGIEDDFLIRAKREAIYTAFDEFEKRFDDIVTSNIKKGYYST